MTDACRILSLDGGGTWALIQAKALGAVYGLDTKGKAILERFDFAFANSGGSIVLAGLIVDRTPREILALLADSQVANRMFDRKRLFWLRRMFSLPRYRTRSKFAELHEQLGEEALQTLNHTSGRKTYIVIVGFDYDRERAFFFRSAPSRRTHATAVKLADAVHASSTAPVRYFDTPAEIAVTVAPTKARETMRLWDGAITGLNNPVAAAVAEAMSVGVGADKISALSIGTGNVVLPNTRVGQSGDPDYVIQPKATGLLATITTLAGSVIGDPPDFASFVAHASLGGGTPALDSDPPVIDGRVVRMNPLVTPAWRDEWQTPDGLDTPEFKRLIKLEMDVTAQDDIDLVVKFADIWIAGAPINQPIRFHFRDPARGMVSEIGMLEFPEALARWDELDPAAKTLRAPSAL